MVKLVVWPPLFLKWPTPLTTMAIRRAATEPFPTPSAVLDIKHEDDFPAVRFVG